MERISIISNDGEVATYRIQSGKLGTFVRKEICTRHLGTARAEEWTTEDFLADLPPGNYLKDGDALIRADAKFAGLI
jgi:hypothetical protein